MLCFCRLADTDELAAVSLTAEAWLSSTGLGMLDDGAGLPAKGIAGRPCRLGVLLIVFPDIV